MSLKPPTPGTTGAPSDARMTTAEGRLTVLETAVFNVRTARGVFAAARGNDSADDYDAITATIADAEAYVAGSSTARGAVVYLPQGVYRTRAMLKIRQPNVTVLGTGPGSPTGSANPAASPVYGGSVIRPAAAFSDAWVLKVGRDEADYALQGNFIRDLSIDGSLCTTLSSGYVTAGSVGGILFQVFNGGMTNVQVARVGGDGIYEEAIGHVTTFPQGAFDNRYLDVKTNGTGGNGFHCSPGATDCIHVGCIHEFANGHGMYLEGSGRQVLGCDIYNCVGQAINGTTRAQVIVGNRFIDCNGGVYLAGSTGDGGAFVIDGNQFRSLSYAGDGLTDGINLTSSVALHGGTIGTNSFSTLLRNGPANAMRWCINIASSNVQGVTIAQQSYDWLSPATRCYVNGKITTAGAGTSRASEAIAQSAVAVPLTGSTAETTLATVTIPGGTLGPNGRLRITATWSATNNANAKTIKVKFGGQAFLNGSAASVASYRSVAEISNRNSQASQVGGGLPSGVDGGGAGTITTATADTTADQALTITGQLGTGTDTLTLEAYLVEVWPS